MDWIAKHLNLMTIVLLLAALFLICAAGAIVVSLLSKERRADIVRFVLEGSEGGKPSISRLQMFIWNIVIAFSFLFVLAKTMSTADPATTQIEILKNALESIFTGPILVLLGISNGTYVLGKITRQADGAPADGVGEAVKSIPTAPVSPPPATPMG